MAPKGRSIKLRAAPIAALFVMWTFYPVAWNLHGLYPMTPGWFSTRVHYDTMQECKEAAELWTEVWGKEHACLPAGEMKEPMSDLDREAEPIQYLPLLRY